MLSAVNFITSRELNIHLQWIGVKMKANWGSQKGKQIYSQILYLAAKEVYPKKLYDHLIVLQGQANSAEMGFNSDHIYRKNLTCHRESIGIIYTPKTHYDNTKTTIREMVTSILLSNYYASPTDSTCLCRSGESFGCLPVLQPKQRITETRIIQCQKDLFAKAIEADLVLTNIFHSTNHSCLKRTPNSRHTPNGLEISRNGILEGDEECDCDYYDDACYEECIPPSWSEIHYKKERQRKKKVRYSIVGGIVAIIVIFSVIGLFLILKKKRKVSTLNLKTIKTVDSWKSQSN
jgi:hypothetical protein